jgi:spermidine/putrescine transport system substrate-binding protein
MTGLVVADGKVSQPITRWADLWNLQPGEKIVVWTLPRYVVGVALKSLGYSINSTNRQELEEALAKLIELKPQIIMVDWVPAIAATNIIEGNAVVGMGQSDDIREARAQNVPMTYVLPAEGAILWGDNYTIPTASTKKESAAAFINFLLRDKTAAKIITETAYWLPNDAAIALLDPAMRDDHVMFPVQEDIRNAEIILPLDAAGEKLHQEIWQQFLEATP